MEANRKSRLDLDKEFRELLGSNNVYFSPPESISLKYPCIVYHVDSIDTPKADNKNYFLNKRYIVTIIDDDPDSGEFDESRGLFSLVEKFLMHFPMCRYANHRVVNNLNHDTFYLYY